MPSPHYTVIASPILIVRQHRCSIAHSRAHTEPMSPLGRAAAWLKSRATLGWFITSVVAQQEARAEEAATTRWGAMVWRGGESRGSGSLVAEMEDGG
ncbi:hypothetical protein NL676_029336 [Syzygium grande]|nr:hypothetical protein NL676_029336 [Syzygium grande]